MMDDQEAAQAVDAWLADPVPQPLAPGALASTNLAAARASGQTPDFAAQSRRLAAEIGVPEYTGRTAPEAVRQRSFEMGLTGLQVAAPKTAAFLDDPGLAAIALDDVPTLTGIEDLFGLGRDYQYMKPGYFGTLGAAPSRLRFERKAPGATLSAPMPAPDTWRGWVAGIWQDSASAAVEVEAGLRGQYQDFRDSIGLGALDRQTGEVQSPELMAYRRRGAGFARELATPEIEDDTKRGIYGGLTSLARAAPSVAASLATANPLPAFLSMGVSTQADAYGKYRERGGTPGEAFLGATGEAAVEIGTELIPTGKMLGAFGKTGEGAIKDFLLGLGLDIPGEQIATFVQDAIDTAIANPDKTWADFAAERPDAAYQTLVATLTQGGIMSALNTTAVMLNRQEVRAEEGEKTAGVLEELDKLAAVSPLRERDPAAFEAFVADVVADGVDSVYVDAKTFAQAAANATPEEQAILEGMASMQGLAEAAETGQDIKIPVAEFAARLAGTSLAPAIIENGRANPFELSRAQAKVAREVQGEELMAEAEKVLASAKVDEAFKASAKVVEDQIVSQLTTVNRFSNDVNKAYAKAHAAFYVVQAARWGVTPEEMAQRYPLRITAEEAPGSNPLRQNLPPLKAPPTSPSGKVRLLHWGKKGKVARLDPKKWGSNPDVLSRTERVMAEDDRHPGRVYFGIGVGQPGGYTPEFGLGEHLYGAEIDIKDLYDYDADPLGLRAGRVKEMLADEGFDAEPEPGMPDYGYYDEAALLYDLAIREAGYKGFWTAEQGSGLIGVSFEKVKAEYQGKNDGQAFYQQASAIEKVKAFFSPENVKDILDKDGWAVMTAANPSATTQSDEENAAANDRLRADLDALGVAYVDANGKYGAEEPSIVIVGITKAQAQALGEKYGQDSILTREGLVYGSANKKFGYGAITPARGVKVYPKRPKNFYTDIPALGTLFSVDLAFGEEIAAPVAGGGTFAQSGVPLFDQPLTIAGKVTVKAIGEAFHADHMAREGRQLFPENDEADYAIVLQGMKDELSAQLEQPNSGVGWYSKDVNDALELASKAFPTLATDQTHRRLYLTLAGLFSNGQDPDFAFMSSAEAFEAYLATGTIPVSRADAAREAGREPKRTSFKDKSGKQVDKDAGWGPRNSANEQQLGFVKFIVEREGSLEAGLNWLMTEQPREAINSAMTAESGLYKAGRYTTKAEISGPPALGVMVFGEKLGRYTMGLHGVDVDAGDVTIDLWYIRTYRRLTGRLFETPIGAEGVVGGPTDKDRQVIIKLTGELSKEFDLPTGDVQAVLWFFEKRLWGAQGLRTNEGTNSSGARKLLRSRGIDDGAGGNAARDGAGTAAAPGSYAQQGTPGGRGENSAGVGTFAQSAVPQTETPAFKTWFGDSKVVDEGGKPLVVYRGQHGATGDLETRLPSLTFSDAAAASLYAEQPNNRAETAQTPAVYPVYLSIQNPIINDKSDPYIDLSVLEAALGRDVVIRVAGKHSRAIEQSGAWADGYAAEFEDVADLIARAPERLGDLPVLAYEILDDPDLVAELAAAGFDGAIHAGVGATFESPEYRVFEPAQVKSAIGNDGTFDANDPSILSQSNPIFYSALARAVEASPTKRAPAAQWKATLAKTPGVKREEIEWTGVEEWLDLQEGVVEREDLSRFLAENGVQLEEVTQGVLTLNEASQFFSNRTIRDVIEYATDRADMIRRLTDELELSESRAEVIVDDLLAGQDPTVRKAEFGNYKLPGADDTYKELLITLPQIDGPSTHWSVDNVVAHARVTERQSADGKRVLFLEEVQSDWHQKGRDQGYQGDVSEERRAEVAGQKLAATDNFFEKATAFVSAAAERLDEVAELYDSVADKEVEMTGAAREETTGAELAQRHKALAADLRAKLRDTETPGAVFTAYRTVLMRMGNTSWSFSAGADKGRETLTPLKQQAEVASLEMNEAEQALANLNRGIPDAPFRKTWSALVMKRMIRYAVDNGFEQVAWINGNQQNGGTTGGDGAFFYERNLVNTTNDLIKKYGTKVEKIDMRSPEEAAARAASRAAGLQTRQELLAEAVSEGDDYQIGLAQHRLDTYNAQTAEMAGEEQPQTRLGFQNGFTITPELAAAASAGMPLFQRGEDRGSFDPNTNTINLLRRADLSTFLHETGHFYLNVLADMASRPDAPAEVVADMEKTLRWFGVPDLQTWLSMSIDEQRPHHEKWARGYEAYLFEGKAPNLGMRELFAKFSAWMKLVYKSLTELNVELDDEVRGVFDRLLATSEEITAAEDARSFLPIFQSKPEGMTDDEWVDYQRLGQQATADAVSELQTRSLRDMKWLSNAKSRALRELQKDAVAKRRKVRDEVTAEVQAEPVYRARTYLKRGEIDGSPVEGALKLSIQGLKDQFAGVAPELQDWTQLGYGKYGMLAEQGMTPDEAADLLGFGSGAELIDALLNAEPMAEKIAGMTDQRMLERYGDLTDPVSMARAAEEAVHNEARIRFVATELNALAKAVGKPSILNAAVKEYAAGIIARLPIKELRPHRYTAAALRAAKASEKALAKGNRLEAVTEKRNQLINLQAARGAWDARAEVEKGMALFTRIAKANDDNLAKSRNMDLVNAARAIMAAYGVGRTKNDPVGYMKALKTYDPALYADLEPFIEAATAKPKPVAELTYEEFIGLRDTVNQLWVMARRSKVIEIDGKQVEIDTATGEMSARLEELGVRPPELDQDPTEGERRLRQISGLRAAARRVEHWSQLLGKPFIKYIWQPVSEAADAYRLEKPVYLRKFLELLEPIKDTLKPIKIAAPEIGFTFTGKSALLHAVLHTGNLSNKTKLLVGRGWGTLTPDGVLDDTKWQALIARLIAEGVFTKADMDFAQGVWNLLEETKPLAQRAHRAMYGRYFAEITADPIQTPWGEYAGGYVPALVDPFSVQAAAMRAGAEAIEEGDHSMFPSPSKGFTQKRNENYQDVLALDLRLLPMHIDKVLKFSHLGPPVRDVLRLLKAKGFSKTLENFDPVAQTELLLPWLNRSVRQRVSTPMTGEAGRMGDSFFRAIRQRTGLGIMFGNLVNALQQLTGFSVSLIKVKPYYLRAAVFNFLRNPTELAESIAQVSPMMADRMASQAYEINQAIDGIILDPNGLDKAIGFFNQHGYFLQHAFQNTVDIVTWQGAYDQAEGDGLRGKDAVRAADAAVRQTQGAMNPEDLARLEAGNAVFRLFTQFSTYFNNLLNLIGTEAGGTIRDMGFKGTPRLIYLYFTAFAVPALAADLIVKAMRGEIEDDEDDGWFDEFLDWFFGSQGRTALAMIPVAGSSVASVFNTFNDKPYDDRIANSPVISTLESAVRAPKSVYSAAVGEGSAKRALKDSLSAIALATGLPVTVLGKPVGYALDVAEGKTKPTGPVDAVRGAVSGAGPSPSY